MRMVLRNPGTDVAPVMQCGTRDPAGFLFGKFRYSIRYCLRACCAMSGTHLAHLAICLRSHDGMSLDDTR
eukprot:2377843-Rhodomonas_salina.7